MISFLKTGVLNLKKYLTDYFAANRSRFFLYSALLILLFAVRIISGFNGLYGQDAYEYLRYSVSLDKFFYKGVNPGSFFWPAGYPLAGAILNLVINIPDLSLQFVSLLSFLFSAIYLEKLLGLFYYEAKDKIKFYLILFFCFSPYLFRSAFLVMTESFSVFCISGLMYHLFRYSKNKSKKNFSLSLLFAMLAIITRYSNFVIVIVPTVYLLVIFIRNFEIKKFLIAVVIIILIVLPHILIYRNNSLNFLHNESLSGWSINNFFSNNFSTSNGFQKYFIINIIYPFAGFIHPAFICTGILFLLFLRKDDFKEEFILLAFPALILYMIFLAGVPYQDFRFLIPSFPLVVLLLFPGFLRITDKFLNRKFRIPVFIVFMIIQLLFIYNYSVGIYRLNKFEKETAQVLKNYNGQETIYTFTFDRSLKYYGIRNPIIDMYKVKVSEISPGSYVLFNEQKFAKQWQNKLPMINWNFMKSHYKLQTLYKFPESYNQEGWVLYRFSK